MATRVARRVLANGLPPTVLLNLNVPSASPEQIKGIKLTRQGRRLYGDEIDERMDPRGREYYWIGGQELGFEQIDGSDMVAVRQGFASLTPISADLTDHSYLEKMMDQSW